MLLIASLFEFRFRAVIVMVLAIGLGNCFIAGRAQAGCGDYILVNGVSVQELQRLAHLKESSETHFDSTAAVNLGNEPNSPSTLPWDVPAVPCDGPRCGKAPPLLPSSNLFKPISVRGVHAIFVDETSLTHGLDEELSYAPEEFSPVKTLVCIWRPPQ